MCACACACACPCLWKWMAPCSHSVHEVASLWTHMWGFPTHTRFLYSSLHMQYNMAAKTKPCCAWRVNDYHLEQLYVLFSGREGMSALSSSLQSSKNSCCRQHLFVLFPLLPTPKDLNILAWSTPKFVYVWLVTLCSVHTAAVHTVHCTPDPWTSSHA